MVPALGQHKRGDCRKRRRSHLTSPWGRRTGGAQLRAPGHSWQRPADPSPTRCSFISCGKGYAVIGGVDGVVPSHAACVPRVMARSNYGSRAQIVKGRWFGVARISFYNSLGDDSSLLHAVAIFCHHHHRSHSRRSRAPLDATVHAEKNAASAVGVSIGCILTSVQTYQPIEIG